jgi:hypothetical protein
VVRDETMQQLFSLIKNISIGTKGEKEKLVEILHVL